MIDEFLSQFDYYTARTYFFLKDMEPKIGFSGAFGNGLPYEYTIFKRDTSDDELLDARALSRWLEALKEGLRRIPQFWFGGG